MIKPGDQIDGRFEFERQLGSGGMGQVWLARDQRLTRLVAIKVVEPSNTSERTSGSDSLIRRLEREARAAAQVQHVNVVQVFDFIEWRSLPVIIMEYVEGRTLGEVISRRGPIDAASTAEIMAQICDGLAAAHRLQLVHRDLKPGNVLLTPDGVARIFDFGISMWEDHRDETLTATGAIVGTPRYMSPEQISGERPDARTDIYAAGLVLFELLTGRPAWESDSMRGLLVRIVAAPPDAAPLRAVGTPDSLVAVFERATQIERQDRWPDATSMAQALRGAVASVPGAHRRTPTPVPLPASGERPVDAVNHRRSESDKPGSPAPTTAPGVGPSKAIVSMLVGLLVLAGGGYALLKPREAAPPANASSDSTPAPPVHSSAQPPTGAPARSPQKPISGGSATKAASVAQAGVEITIDTAAAIARTASALASALRPRWGVAVRALDADQVSGVDSLRADFLVVVDAGGRVGDLKPSGMSGVARFDDVAAETIQEVDQVRSDNAGLQARYRVSFVARRVVVEPER